jgi:hypothetical protein
MTDSKTNKRDYLRLKYNNMQLYLISNSTLNTNELENNEDIKSFKEMTEEQIIVFAIKNLKTYKKDLTFQAKKILDVFKIDTNNRSILLMIINYLELILSLIE